MYKFSLLLIPLILFSPGTQAAPQQGDVLGENNNIQVWHEDLSNWISPEKYFSIEIKRYDGKFYGTVSRYPSYQSVNEYDTLVDQLSDGSVCPMVFFHQRWRRLPDVLALDERLRNYGGCANVFND